MGYFSISEPLKNIFRIADPLGTISTLIVGAESALLVDTGYGIGNIADAAAAITELPVTALNSHEHVDHICGGYRFDSVLMPAAGIEQVRAADFMPGMKKLILKAASSLEIPADFSEEAFFAYNFDNLIPFECGKIFDLGGKTVEVLPMPSHSPASVVFLCREDRLLLTCDAVAPLTSLVCPGSLPPEEHIKWLDKTEQYDFDFMLCSHSERLMPKAMIATFRECAANYAGAPSYRYREPYYPNIKGRVYFYNSDAAIIVRPDYS